MSDMVFYEGRYVPRQGFRVFVYDVACQPRLVDSWKEYESLVQTGVWFASIEKARSAAFVAKVNEEGDEEPCGKQVWVAPELTHVTTDFPCDDYEKCDAESQMCAIQGCDGETSHPATKNEKVVSETDSIKKSKKLNRKKV